MLKSLKEHTAVFACFTTITCNYWAFSSVFLVHFSIKISSIPSCLPSVLCYCGIILPQEVTVMKLKADMAADFHTVGKYLETHAVI